MNKLQMKIYCNFSELSEIKSQWNTLVNDSTFPNIFLTWEWLSLWLDFFGRSCRLQTVAFFSGPTLVAAMPIYECKVSFMRGHGTSSLCLIGDGPLVSPDYLGPIVKNEYVEVVTGMLTTYFDKVFSKYGVVRLSALNKKSEGTARLINNLEKFYQIIILAEESCPILLLPDSYESFLAGLSKKRKKRIEYEIRRAEKKFDVYLKCFREENDAGKIFDVIAKVYDRSSKRYTVANGFANIDYLDFHKKVMLDFAKKGWLRFYVLSFNNEPVSYVYGYVFNNTFWFYQTSFDVSQKKFAPGSIILQLVIESVINEGIKEFDFLRGEEPYKYQYNTGERKLHTALVFRSKNLHYYQFKIVEMLSKFYKKLKEKRNDRYS